MTAIRVRKQKVGKRGLRGLVVSISPTVASDLGVTAGESLSLYRAVFAGKQVIIMANADEPVLTDENSTQGRELAEFMEAQV